MQFPGISHLAKASFVGTINVISRVNERDWSLLVRGGTQKVLLNQLDQTHGDEAFRRKLEKPYRSDPSKTLLDASPNQAKYFIKIIIPTTIDLSVRE